MEFNKEEVLKELHKKEEPNRHKGGKVIEMKYNPFEGMAEGHRRCGNCGDIYDLKEFKVKGKPGYDWKCSDCRDYTEAYK